MRQLSELNINEGGKPVPYASPSATLISRFEAQFGNVMPLELQQLLEHSNGGHPELNSVGGGEGLYAVDRFLRLVEQTDDTEGMWWWMAAWRPILGPKAIPFATTGGGDPFFLDVTSSPPSVQLCLHDAGFQRVFVAPSFEAFIDSLDIDPDMI